MAPLQPAPPKASGEVALLDGYSEKEAFERKQYELIVQFRDAILSGNHAVIKLPHGVAARPYTPARPASKPQPENGEGDAEMHKAMEADASVVTASAGETTRIAADINPILLEKSDELILAEIQLQRQRIERSLKEDLEQNRVLKLGQTNLSGFELSEVLTKALTLVQSTAAPMLSDAGLNADNQDGASDSFDDNTFYSSRHDTPESQLAARVRNESQTMHDLRESASYEPEQILPETEKTNAPTFPPAADEVLPGYGAQARRQVDIPGLGTAAYSAPLPAQPPRPAEVPGLNNYTNAALPSGQTSLYNSSGEHSQSGDSGVMEVDHHGGHVAGNTTRQLDDTYVVNHPPSPLVRGHDLMPVAPQPASAPNPAVERTLAQNAERNAHLSIGAPAQVAALRNKPTPATSTNSSSGTSKGGNKKKDKKKKRKAERQAPDEYEAYIKPEPRSPSPVSAPAFVRPNKRQKQAQRQADAASQAEPPPPPPPPASIPQPQYDPLVYQEPVQVTYAPPAGYPQRTASRAVIQDSRPAIEYVDDGRVPQEGFYRRPPSARSSAYYHPDAGHAPRPLSRIATDDARDAPRYYRDAYEGNRMSARPEAEAYELQPRAQPTRIYVDAFGREYLEPPRPVPRPPPVVQPADQEVVYERTLPREVSRHPMPTNYDDSNIMYTRSTSTYPSTRRVVTQPEYAAAPSEYRDIRPAEYSTRPIAQPTEYVRYMPAPERMAPPEGAPRDYVARPPSVHPVEAQRYEPQREYVGFHNTRPEIPQREYASSVLPDSRRELPPPPPPAQYMMEYETRPVEHSYAQAGYPVRPVERYYEQPTHGGEGFAFVERPRGATQEIVYADDARREVHR